MTDRAYIVSRTLENKIAIAENNDQNTLLVTLDVLKEILAVLKEQEHQIWELQEINEYLTDKLKEQEAEIRQLRLALDIAKGTCKGIKSGGGQFADMPTMQSAT